MSADQAQAIADIEDEPYDSAEDEDFQVDAGQDESELSSDEEADAEPAKKKRKTHKKANATEDIELDSGDEATIKKAQDKRKKRKGKRGKDGDDDSDEDEGASGGFVRTRAMKSRVQEERERKPLAKIDGATVDVDALWEQMNTPGNELGLPTSQTIKQPELPSKSESETNTEKQEQPAAESRDQAYNDQYNDQMIKIKRTYKFAGEWITEEKSVPKDSAEAKVFLASGEPVEYTDAEAVNAARNIRRPLRKVSRFDPNPTGAIKKSWEKQPVEAGEGDAKGPKINTVEKSRLDWAQYVDEAGIKEELRTHSKAKEGYMGRMDFLGRMDAKREEEARQARLKGM
ncbi:Craniofacial development protein 1/Bucentaur [Penicillium citrinum]|uniref:SWR1-complex protein 5 n=1 Tax=Penicillium citrinum TaxID=5077 RepID=A0A9W9TUY0_PENCI|nr:Craniofacial development protein 1/Bucentaur [Penicillium citrinum]KAJ5241553.1 Craniofacial development protein 1/Bucentaur [Penicillium citrinum]